MANPFTVRVYMNSQKQYEVTVNGKTVLRTADQKQAFITAKNLSQSNQVRALVQSYEPRTVFMAFADGRTQGEEATV